MVRYILLISVLLLLGSCDGDSYSTKDYYKYRSDDALNDVVHEWIGDYVENYCRVQAGGSITCS